MQNYERSPEKNYTIDLIMPGVKLTMEIAKKVRALTLDYALGAAILGSIPIYGRWIPLLRIALLMVLILVMVKKIGRFWGDRRGQGIGETISCIFGLIAAVALACMTWVGILLLSLLIPFVDILARAAAYGVLTFNIGQTMSRYYYNPHILDSKALQKALKFYRSL